MKMRRMISVGIAGMIAGVSLVLASCLHDDSTPQPAIPVAYVALYDESPNAPDLQFVADNNQIGGRFHYSDYTTYLPFYTGSRTIKVGPFGASNTVVDTTVTLANNTFYSMFLVDEYSKAKLLIVSDSGQAPGAGNVMVRLVNASPDAGNVQLKVSGVSVVDGLGFKSVSAYAQADAKTTSFTVTSDGDSSVNLNIPATSLTEGHFYTIVVRGYKTPATGNTNVLSADLVGN